MSDITEKRLKVAKVVWYSKDTRWGILGCEPIEGIEGLEDLINDFGNVTLAGNFEGVYEGVEVIVTGDIKVHPKFGKQIIIESLKILQDTNSREGIINFLAKSNIRGINVKNATKIYDHFGSDSIDIVFKHPERIMEIKGLSVKTYEKVLAGVKEYESSKELIDYCTNIGLKYSSIIKIKKELKDKALHIIKTNPFSVCKLVKGISFKQMDTIFLKNGGSPTAKERLTTALLQTLEEIVTLEGSTGCSYNKVHSRYRTLLEFSDMDDYFYKTIKLLEEENKVYFDEVSQVLYYKEYIDTEKRIAEALITLEKEGMSSVVLEDPYVASVVDEEMKDFPFQLNDQQKEAIINCLKHRVSVLTGCAGCLTGDTLIRYSRGFRKETCTLKDLYDEFTIDTKVRSYIESKGAIKLNMVKKVVYSGKKEVYKLTLADGKTLKATATHEIMTFEGFKELQTLTIKDYVMVDNFRYHGLPEYSQIVSIEYIGIEDTYDICCYENHNFVANGMVVHNSGKSSITKALYSIYNRLGYEVLLLAPTAKAARRLEECIPSGEAQTIHKYLAKQKGVINSGSTVFVVDEASMVDIMLIDELLSTAGPLSRILLVGDNNQLPSIQAGNVLGDVIKSGVIQTNVLTNITRQKENSHIIKYCSMINEGIIVEPCIYPDFHYEEFGNASELKEILVEKYIDEVIKYGLSEVQVIAPYKKGEVGMNTLNLFLQNAYQNEFLGSECIPPYRKGDRVRHTVNNYDKNVFNGEVGIVTDYDEDDEVLFVDYGNKVITYNDLDLEELTLSYASTVHASQGSEYKVVFVVLDDTSINDFLLIRRLLYTAVSRGKEKVYILTKPYLVDRCINNDSFKPRVTKLCSYLCEVFNI